MSPSFFYKINGIMLTQANQLNFIEITVDLIDNITKSGGANYSARFEEEWRRNFE